MRLSEASTQKNVNLLHHFRHHQILGKNVALCCEKFQLLYIMQMQCSVVVELLDSQSGNLGAMPSCAHDEGKVATERRYVPQLQCRLTEK